MTADLGLKLKARSRQIEVLTLPDELKLPEEPDPNEIRIKKLEAKVRELSAALPELRIAFDDGSDHKRFRVFKVQELSPGIIDPCLAQVRDHYPKLSTSTGLSAAPGSGPDLVYGQLAEKPRAFTAPFKRLAPEDISRYNDQLESFYHEYTEFLPQLWEYQATCARQVEIELRLCNAGTAPADDIDVALHFPDGFSVRDSDKRGGPPIPPEPPGIPVPWILKHLGMGNWRMLQRHINPMAHFRMPDIGPLGNVSGPDIRKSGSYDVGFQVRRLKHGFSEPMAPLLLTFDSFDSAQSFQIDYRINAANMPRESEGQLHVIIDKVEEPLAFRLPPLKEKEDGAEEGEQENE